jgi:hypothetical protein
MTLLKIGLTLFLFLLITILVCIIAPKSFANCDTLWGTCPSGTISCNDLGCENQCPNGYSNSGNMCLANIWGNLGVGKLFQCCIQNTNAKPSCSSAGGTCQTVSVCNYMGGTGKSGYNCANTCCFVPTVCEQRGGYCADAYHGGSCSSNYYPNGTLGCTGTAPFCCYPKYLAPTCNQISNQNSNCTPWTWTTNSCYNGNATRTCYYGSYSGGGYCNGTYQTQTGTIGCSASYTCINGYCYTTISAHVFVDFNADGIENNNELPISGSTVRVNGQNLTADNNGNITSQKFVPGTYPVSAPTPAKGYTNVWQATTENPISVTLGSKANIRFGFTPLYTISGVMFNDKNKNGVFDTGEALANPVTIVGPSYSTKTTIDTNGAFLIQHLLPGTYTISTDLPNSRYRFAKGTLSSYTVTVGTPNKNPACNGKGSPANCDNAGNITNVAFQLSDENPWSQGVCTDLRFDNGITNPAPATGSCGGVTNAYLNITNETCSTPGLVFSGDSDANFSPGNVSATGQMVGGGGNFSENFKPVNPRIIRTSYQYIMTTIQNNDIQATNLVDICPLLSDCILPATIASGVYHANDDVVLNAVTFPSDRKILMVIHGNLAILGNILVPTGSSVIFIVSGNIIIDKSVGESDITSQDANIQGLYSTDNSFVINSFAISNKICNDDGSSIDKRLNIVGSVIVNAAATGGELINTRDLCASDTTCPVMSISMGNGNVSGNRPNAGNGVTYLLNAPSVIKHPNTVWQEVAP